MVSHIVAPTPVTAATHRRLSRRDWLAPTGRPACIGTILATGPAPPHAAGMHPCMTASISSATMPPRSAAAARSRRPRTSAGGGAATRRWRPASAAPANSAAAGSRFIAPVVIDALEPPARALARDHRGVPGQRHRIRHRSRRRGHDAVLHPSRTAPRRPRYGERTTGSGFDRLGPRRFLLARIGTPNPDDGEAPGWEPRRAAGRNCTEFTVRPPRPKPPGGNRVRFLEAAGAARA